MSAKDADADNAMELDYSKRQSLTEWADATLIYDSPYSGTTVEVEVTIIATSGSVTVETQDGREWGIFGKSIRTTVNSRRASGTVDAKNGRLVGYLVSIEQDDDAEDDEIVGCLGCDFGYDPDEYDECPVCANDEDDETEQPRPVTDGGVATIEQTKIGSHAGREIVEYERGGDGLGRGVYCPDCGQEVTATKGSHPAPDDCEAGKIWGWQCRDCKNTLPSNTHSAKARGFNDRIVGIKADPRGGEERWIPVPVSSLQGGE